MTTPINKTQEPVPAYFSTINTWATINKETNLNWYPKPQGSLPMFNWGLRKEEQLKMLNAYNNVGSLANRNQ
jgi:hypothetical protein